MNEAVFVGGVLLDRLTSRGQTVLYTAQIAWVHAYDPWRVELNELRAMNKINQTFARVENSFTAYDTWRVEHDELRALKKQSRMIKHETPAIRVYTQTGYHKLCKYSMMRRDKDLIKEMDEKYFRSEPVSSDPESAVQLVSKNGEPVFINVDQVELVMQDPDGGVRIVLTDNTRLQVQGEFREIMAMFAHAVELRSRSASPVSSDPESADDEQVIAIIRREMVLAKACGAPIQAALQRANELLKPMGIDISPYINASTRK
jgi:hypothetical protein